MNFQPELAAKVMAGADWDVDQLAATMAQVLEEDDDDA